MRSFAVLATLALSFLAPLAVPVAQASEPGTVAAVSSDASCRHRRAKKPQQPAEGKKKKDKDGKKPYGFEL
jgi:hypothetical protein